MLPRPAGRSCPAGWGECPSRRGSRCSSRRSSRCGFRSWGRCDAGYRISSHMKRTTSAQPLALKRTPSFSSNSRCCGQPGAVRPALLTTRWQGSSAGAEAMARPTRRAWSGMPINPAGDSPVKRLRGKVCATTGVPRRQSPACRLSVCNGFRSIAVCGGFIRR